MNEYKQSNLVYKKLAKYYDLVYLHKDYRKEANKILYLINKYKKSEGNELLDIACGTGKHLEYFQNKFSCTGVDLNQSMLEIAKQRLKRTKLLRMNMLDLKLKSHFDVITCLFGAIGYTQNYQNLKKVINSFYKYLNPGGVLIIESWYNKEQWKAGSTGIGIYGNNNLKIIRAGYNEIKKNIAVFNEHYLIVENNKGIEHFSSKQYFGLFDAKNTINILNSSGLELKIIKSAVNNNEKYVAIKST